MTQLTHTMRICYVAYPTSLTLGSANAVQTYSTLRELRDQHNDLQIIIPRMTNEPNPFDGLAVTYIPRIGIGRLSRLHKSTLWYYAERSVFAWIVFVLLWVQRVRGTQTDVIYVREVICAYWLAQWAPRWLNAKVIYEVHHLEATNHSRPKEPWATPFVQRLDQVTLRDPARLVSLTSTFRAILEKDGLRASATVDILPDAYNDAIYHPTDQQRARLALDIPASCTMICYAGLTFAYRRLELLVDAFGQMDEAARSNTRIYFVGGRPQEVIDLKQRCADARISDAVFFVGVQPQPIVAQYMAASDILVIPDTVTDETASPLKLFEYMAMGRVVLCPDMKSLREIIGADGACVFERGNISALRIQLRALIESPQLRDQFAQRGLTAVAAHTYRNRANRLIAVCRSAVLGSHDG
jgi:glycosyltransferase involved in cell wall biosynthesis